MLNNCIYYSASGAKLHPFLSLLRKRTAKNHARTAGQFGDLLTEHLEIGGELVTDLKNDETAKADDARRRWYANADAISAFLAGINACWNEETWREFLLQPSGDDGKRSGAAPAERLCGRHPHVRPDRDRGAADGRRYVLLSGHAQPRNAQRETPNGVSRCM